MDIQALKLNLCRVFDDKLKTKQWHNILDYVIIGLIIISTLEVFLSTYSSIVDLFFVENEAQPDVYTNGWKSVV